MRTILTGSGSGIGLATARALAARPDARILLVDRNPERRAANAEELRGIGAQVAESGGDLNDPDSPAAFVEAAVGAFGGIDAVVSNAGSIAGGAELKSLSTEAFEAAFAINTRPTFLLARAAYPYLKESRGAIVAVASTAAAHPVPNLGGYSPSKAALVMLVRQMALEWGPDGIRANCVSPGPTATPMAPVYADPQIRSLRASTLPLRRISEPEEIAETILFLLGPGAIGITGVNLEVDCGMGLTTMQLSGSGLNRPDQ
jgi:NAD(P)-dependent dehydrogenase (short-subunit alcohol dehydrogenase family)